jgi:hypothetical protein
MKLQDTVSGTILSERLAIEWEEKCCRIRRGKSAQDRADPWKLAIVLSGTLGHKYQICTPDS